MNLHVSEQQYAYARQTGSVAVIVAFNNDNKEAEFEFDVSRAELRNGASLRDRLGISRDVVVRDGKVKVSLPKRSAAILSIL